MPNQKPGIAIADADAAETMRSGVLFLCRAAQIPAGIPIATEIASAAKASIKE